MGPIQPEAIGVQGFTPAVLSLWKLNMTLDPVLRARIAKAYKKDPAVKRYVDTLHLDIRPADYPSDPTKPREKK
jgi:hypothetical protein